MARLTSDDLQFIARTLHNEHHRRVYFYVPSDFSVHRDCLRFSHIHIHHQYGEQYHLPIYTFNDKLYVHTNPTCPPGYGNKVGPASLSGSHYYPMD